MEPRRLLRGVRKQPVDYDQQQGINPATNTSLPDSALPLSPHQIVQLQRTCGNRYVQRLMTQNRVVVSKSLHQRTATPRSIQRDIFVENIDFNPLASEDTAMSHGFIDVKKFPNQLKENLTQFYSTGIQGGSKQSKVNDPYVNFRGKLNDVIEEVKKYAVTGDDTPTYKAPDIPKLTDVIVKDLKKIYGEKGVVLGAWDSMIKGVSDAVESALLATLHEDYSMVGSEKSAFDKLIQNAGTEASRKKGEPTKLSKSQLGDVEAAVQTAYDAIEKYHNDMKKTTFQFEWTDDNLMRNYWGNMPFYQGNHTNMAGWLPARVLPASWMNTLSNAIKTNAGVAAIPGLVSALNAKTPQANFTKNYKWKQAYDPAFATAANAYDDDAFRQMAWLAMGSGVSAYIEFNLPGQSDGISRLLYDFVGNKFYVTAHYKWRNGYNPFFEITDLKL